MNKVDLRASVASDLSAFFSNGGEVTVLKSQTVRRKYTAACRHRRGVASKQEGFRGAEPKPVHSWCNWSGDRLLNIDYKVGKVLSH